MKIKLTLVANQSLRIPRSEYIDTVLVRDGANVADRRIIELVAPGDLVVTADIPLAAKVVAKGDHQSELVHLKLTAARTSTGGLGNVCESP